MINKQIILGVLLLCTMIFASCSNDEKVVFTYADEGGTPVDPNAPTQPLKDKAKFKIGAAVKFSNLQTDAKYKDLVLKNYSQITAEYEMKMETIWGSTSYNWTAADNIVNFAQDNHLEVHGHTLIWYNSFPDWFKNQKNDSIAFEAKVKVYIKDVVGRYKGKVKSWDVVNEVFADGGALRDETVIKPVFKDPIGFYGRCFQYAKEADPDAKLFYNDYSVVIDAGKRAAIKKMVAKFKAKGYPIDGLGDQFHYGVDTNRQIMSTGFADLASTGLLIHVSELDIKVNVNKSDAYVFSSDEAQKQSDTYKYIVEMYETLPQNQKFAITTWGVTDKYTWLTTAWHSKEYPLLFDSEYSKKPAYLGFLSGLK